MDKYKSRDRYDDRHRGSKPFRKPKDSSSESDDSIELRKESSSKKRKFHKDKRRNRSSSTSSDSSSDSSESVEEKKSSRKSSSKHKKDKRGRRDRERSSASPSGSLQEATSKPKDAREGWMSLDVNFSDFGRERLKNKREVKPPVSEKERSRRELNPYWKDGGKGVPDKKPSPRDHSHYALSYLEGVLRRAGEEAKARNMPLDEVLAERWGSEKAFREILRSAEERELTSKHRKSFVRPRDDYGRSHHYEGRASSGRWRKQGNSREEQREERKSDDRKETERKSDDRKETERKSDDRKETERKSDDRKETERKSDDRKETERKSDDRKETERKRPSPSESSQRVASPPLAKEPSEEPNKELTKNDLNALSAAVMKAEWSGNQEAIAKAKADLEKAKSEMKEARRPSTKVIVLPTSTSSKESYSKGPKRVQTHEDGQRVRYFADDDNMSLNEMYVKERGTSGSHKVDLFGRISKQKIGADGSSRDLDDVFEETASKRKTVEQEQLDNDRALIKEQIKKEKIFDDCSWCIDGKKFEQRTVAHVGSKVYLGVPTSQSLTPGHCLIIPTSHVSCGISADEDVWSEVQDYRKAVVKMFLEDDQDVIFFESAIYLNKYPHMVLEAVPVPKEIGDLAPIFFKKAIQESETEWAINKKLVDLSGKGLRKSVPKGLPYFAVFFGLQDGFAHVIEDIKMFPSNFAQEIIGGMMDLDHQLWHKRKRQTSEAIEKNRRELKKMFHGFAPMKT